MCLIRDTFISYKFKFISEFKLRFIVLALVFLKVILKAFLMFYNRLVKKYNN